jgi:DinB superfamily
MKVFRLSWKKESPFSKENSMDLHTYPIGKHTPVDQPDIHFIQAQIDRIAALPNHLRNTVLDLKPHQLSAGYRPNSWTARQIVHHLADSHMNMYIRLKLTLTEDTPIIKPYLQDAWARFEEAEFGDIESSLQIIDILHQRVARILRELDDKALKRSYFHPESQKTFSLAEMIQLYAWHGDHHCAQMDVIKKLFP